MENRRTMKRNTGSEARYLAVAGTGWAAGGSDEIDPSCF